jgi:hypothetical protein
MACGQEMTYGRSIYPRGSAVCGGGGDGVPVGSSGGNGDELEVLSTRQLRERGKALGVVPVGDGRTAEAWGLVGSKAARGAAQQAVAVAAVAAAEAATLTESAAAAGAEAVAELHRQVGFSASARGRVRKLAPSDSRGSGAAGGGG